MSLLWNAGTFELRATVRRLAIRLRHEPPRRTRCWPAPGPIGLVRSLELYGAYQSLHHSWTLPASSSMPNGLAPRGKTPTGAVCAYPSSIEVSRQTRFVRESAKFACFPLANSSPHGKSRPSGPRAAYSHSASVGSRYFLPSFWLSHLQKAIASFQLT